MEFLVFSEDRAAVEEALNRLVTSLPNFQLSWKLGGNFVLVKISVKADPLIFEELLKKKLTSSLGAGNFLIRRLT